MLTLTVNYCSWKVEFSVYNNFFFCIYNTLLQCDIDFLFNPFHY